MAQARGRSCRSRRRAASRRASARRATRRCPSYKRLLDLARAAHRDERVLVGRAQRGMVGVGDQRRHRLVEAQADDLARDVLRRAGVASARRAPLASARWIVAPLSTSVPSQSKIASLVISSWTAGACGRAPCRGRGARLARRGALARRNALADGRAARRGAAFSGRGGPRGRILACHFRLGPCRRARRRRLHRANAARPCAPCAPVLAAAATRLILVSSDLAGSGLSSGSMSPANCSNPSVASVSAKWSAIRRYGRSPCRRCRRSAAAARAGASCG